MVAIRSQFGFVECADFISVQNYPAALKTFQQAVTKFLESKSTPRRNEIARQLFQIGTALEDTLKKAYGETWDAQVPKFADAEKQLGCSFCGKNQNEVRKLIAGSSVHICDECVGLCGEILVKENVEKKEVADHPTEERLCGICMEQRESDELIFLPHAAYMCAGCLEEIQLVRDKQGGQV
jgi:hypothetical protein